MRPWTAALGPARTDQQVAELRADVSKHFGVGSFTCDDCPSRRTCEWAFDVYNTDGDCLAEK